MKQRTKNNLISLLIGTAVGIPLSLYAVSHRSPSTELLPRPEPVVVQARTEDLDQTKEDDLQRNRLDTYYETDADIAAEEYEGELELLATLVEAEAGNQDMTGKRLVVDVVLNRVDSEDYPDTITGVIMQPGQFSTVTDGALDRAGWTVNDSDFEAVRAELDERLDNEILFFTAGYYNPYGTPAYQHGDHYFSH